MVLSLRRRHVSFGRAISGQSVVDTRQETLALHAKTRYLRGIVAFLQFPFTAHVLTLTDGMYAHERSVAGQPAVTSSQFVLIAVWTVAAGERNGTVYHGQHARRGHDLYSGEQVHCGKSHLVRRIEPFRPV